MGALVRGDRLRELRESAALDLIDVAVATGVDRSHLNKIELGQKQPSIATLVALARFFNASPDYLLGWSDRRLPVQGEQPGDQLDEGALAALIRRVISEVDRSPQAMRAKGEPASLQRKRARKPDDDAV